MTTNTNTALRPSSARIDHTHCLHPSTKQGRATCRRSGRVAQATIATAVTPVNVPLTCSCNIPLEQAVCPICDLPADAMTALGLLLTS